MIRLTLLLVITAIASLGAPLDCALLNTLTDYIGLDPEGCRLGTRVLSDFELLPLTQGSIEIDPNEIFVEASVSGPTGSLLFTYNRFTGSDILESILQMTVKPDAFFEKVDLQLIGVSVSGDAVVTGLAEVCPDGIGPGGGCLGASQPVLALFSATDNIPAIGAMVGPTQSYDILYDIMVDPGTLGAASLAAAQLTFTSIPEPATVATFCAGFFSMLILRRRLNK